MATLAEKRHVVRLGPAFHRFWLSDTVSMAGTQISAVALPVIAVTQLNASASEVGVLVAAEEGAWLLIGLLAGAWVDQWSKRRVVAWTDAGRGLLLASIPLAWWLGILTMSQLWVVGLLVGALTVFFTIAYQAYLPSLVPHEDLVDANARLATSQATTSVAGPGLGGVLVQALTAPVAILFDAVSFMASALLLGSLPVEERRPKPEVRQPLREQIGEGLRYVFADPVLRALTGTGAALNFCVAAQHTLVTVFLLRVLNVSTGVLGLLLAFTGVGGVAGGLLASRLARRLSSGTAVRIGLVLGPVGGLCVPLAEPGWWASLFAIGTAFLAGGIAIFNVITGAWRQASCPPELLGRMVASTRTVTWGALPVGALVGGSLGDAVGVRTTLVLIAFGFVLIPCVLATTRLWRIREFE
ncbi:MFS transporter [Streptomyces sp. NPDC007896]|uniref:MFS transporter n=1 Tax=unclassified Streptomyces TaxID=2593676 RepID=UPI0036E0A8D5